MTVLSDDFDIDVFEKATELVAKRLAFFRTDDSDAEPTENEKLTAGHLIGGLYANGYIRQPPPHHGECAGDSKEKL